MAEARRVSININGKAQDVDAAAGRSLLEVLQEDLHLPGVHYGCGSGDCGACGVLVDGRRALSCQLSVGDVAGKQVVTVDGLAEGEKLHPVQQAFLDVGGFQCGYCTPGMITSVIGHLNETPSLSDDALLAKMNDNLCRCCGYVRIAQAIRQAAAAVRKEAGR